jgi:hypothetical protein
MQHTYLGDTWDRSRSWLPVDTEGDDMLFIESLFLGPQADLGNELEQPGRYNWYRRVELPAQP